MREDGAGASGATKMFMTGKSEHHTRREAFVMKPQRSSRMQKTKNTIELLQIENKTMTAVLERIKTQENKMSWTTSQKMWNGTERKYPNKKKKNITKKPKQKSSSSNKTTTIQIHGIRAEKPLQIRELSLIHI